MSLVPALLCSLTALLILAGAALLALLKQDARLGRRIAEIKGRADVRPEGEKAPPMPGLLRPVAALGGLIARSGLLSTGTLAELQATLHIAGMRGRGGLSLFVGGKLLGMAGLPAIMLLMMQEAAWWPSLWLALLGGAGIAGLLTPDLVVRHRRKAYLNALDQGLPDALDMLVICSEAGLGLEAAFERVGAEIGHGHPAVAQEMQTTLQEMRINADRRAALTGLGTRTGLDNLRRLGATLVQTMQYGTPLSQALRSLSAEMRQELLIRFEGRAARLGVLLTLPMILFILPCVFLVVGGPALIQVLQSHN